MADFLNGVIFKRRDNAPDFVVGQLSIKTEEFITTLRQNDKNGWVNANIKKSRDGKYYVELDTWEPSQQGNNIRNNAPSNQGATSAPPVTAFNEDSGDDLPF